MGTPRCTPLPLGDPGIARLYRPRRDSCARNLALWRWTTRAGSSQGAGGVEIVPRPAFPADASLPDDPHTRTLRQNAAFLTYPRNSAKMWPVGWEAFKQWGGDVARLDQRNTLRMPWRRPGDRELSIGREGPFVTTRKPS